MSSCGAPNRSVKLVSLVLALIAGAACSSTKNNKEDTTNNPSLGAGSGGMSAAPTGTGGSAASGTGGSTSAGNNSGSGGMSASGGGSGGMTAMQDADNDAGMGDTNMPEDGGMMEPPCDKMVTPSTDCTAMLAPGDERTCMIGSREYIVY